MPRPLLRLGQVWRRGLVRVSALPRLLLLALVLWLALDLASVLVLPLLLEQVQRQVRVLHSLPLLLPQPEPGRRLVSVRVSMPQ